jgi:6-phosphofructokinase 2
VKSIVTLTVNPTVDINTSVGQVVPERKLRCDAPRREPGGGGVNVARAVRRLGGEATALYLAGGPSGDMLVGLLDDEELAHRRIPIEGWTRENVIVYEEASTLQYRFGMPGPHVDEAEWRACLEALAALEPAPDYLVASGSLPPGVPADFFAHVAEAAAGLGARLIVDTSGEALRRAAETGAYLLKPNLRELQELAGEELGGEQEQLDAARRLVDGGAVGVLVISLGAGGAVVVTPDHSEHIRTPTVPIRSKVGAGDSMVAGITVALAREWDLVEAARFGVAAGAAAVMTEGTELCRRDDTERLYAQMTGTMEES